MFGEPQTWLEEPVEVGHPFGPPLQTAEQPIDVRGSSPKVRRSLVTRLAPLVPCAFPGFRALDHSELACRALRCLGEQLVVLGGERVVPQERQVTYEASICRRE